MFLGYSCPIYYGCKNINDYFDENSYIGIDINNIDACIAKIEYTLSNSNIFSNKTIALARKKVLEKYNFFNIISETINKETLRSTASI